MLFDGFVFQLPRAAGRPYVIFVAGLLVQWASPLLRLVLEGGGMFTERNN